MTSVRTQPVRKDMEEPKEKSYSPRRIETMMDDRTRDSPSLSPPVLSPAYKTGMLQGYRNQDLEPTMLSLSPVYVRKTGEQSPSEDIGQRSKELHGSESAVPGGTIPTGRGKESQILNEGVPVGSHDPSLGAADLTRKEARHFSNGFDKQGKAILTSRREQSHIPCECATAMTGAQMDMHHTRTASLESSMAGYNDDRGSKGPGTRPEVSRYPSIDGFMGNGSQDPTLRNDQSIRWSNIAGQGQHMGLVQTSIHNSLPSASHIPSSIKDNRDLGVQRNERQAFMESQRTNYGDGLISKHTYEAEMPGFNPELNTNMGGYTRIQEEKIAGITNGLGEQGGGSQSLGLPYPYPVDSAIKDKHGNARAQNSMPPIEAVLNHGSTSGFMEGRQVNGPRVNGGRNYQQCINQIPQEHQVRGYVNQARRPCIIPDRFDGSISWRDYKEHFEACAAINDWAVKDKARFLAASLKGVAQPVLGDKSEPSYHELMQLLERRFGPGQRAEVYLAELRGRQRKPNESIQELGHAIRRLTALAYPELAKDAQDRLGKTHFIDAEPDKEIRVGIYRANTASLDEAIRIALEIESFMETERMRHGVQRSRQVRSLEGNSQRVEVELSRMSQHIQELEKQLKSSKEDAKKSSVRYRCWHCGQPGHIMRNCRVKKQNKRQRSQGTTSETIVARRNNTDDRNWREQTIRRGRTHDMNASKNGMRRFHDVVKPNVSQRHSARTETKGWENPQRYSVSFDRPSNHNDCRRYRRSGDHTGQNMGAKKKRKKGIRVDVKEKDKNSFSQASMPTLGTEQCRKTRTRGNNTEVKESTIPQSHKKRDDPRRQDVGDQSSKLRTDRAAEGLFVCGFVAGSEVDFLIDTGSSDTYISMSIYQSILSHRRPTLQPMPDVVRQAGGQLLPTRGRVVTEIQIGNHKEEMEVIVADLSGAAIVGLDFLIKQGLSVDLEHMELRKGERATPCYDKTGQKLCARLIMSQSVTVPAGHEVFANTRIKGKYTNDWQCSALVEPTDRNKLAEKGLLLAKTLVSVKCPIVPIRLCNPGNDVVELRKGKDAGVIYKSDSKQIVDDATEKSNTLSVDKPAVVGSYELPEHLVDLHSRACEELSAQEGNLLGKLLWEYRDVFLIGPHDLGRYHYVGHSIHTQDAVPLTERFRRLSVFQQDIADKVVHFWAMLCPRRGWQPTLVKSSVSRICRPLLRKLREYKCRSCTRVFTNLPNLRRHGKERHEDRCFNCSQCSKSQSPGSVSIDAGGSPVSQPATKQEPAKRGGKDLKLLGLPVSDDEGESEQMERKRVRVVTEEEVRELFRDGNLVERITIKREYAKDD